MAPHESAGMASGAGAAMTEAAMSRWTDEELRELVALWPKSTAAQIAYRLRRPRAAVCGKVQRLLREGLLEGKNAKHPDPQKRRTRARPPRTRIMLPPPQVDDSPAMQPCSILELDITRCHWPLGPIDEVATEFCGEPPAPGHRYCPHHLRMARYSFL
jgi:hypothetical protein